jgi:hypothetical protein
MLPPPLSVACLPDDIAAAPFSACSPAAPLFLFQAPFSVQKVISPLATSQEKKLLWRRGGPVSNCCHNYFQLAPAFHLHSALSFGWE